KAVCILLELRSFGCGITITEYQQIDFGYGVARLLNLQQRTGRRRPRRVDELVVRIYVHTPDLVKARLACTATLKQNMDWYRRGREAQRLGEGPIHAFRFVCGDPLAIDGIESARVERASARRIIDLEEVIAQIAIIYIFSRISRPGQGFDDNPIEAEGLLPDFSRVVVIQSHRGRRGKDIRRRKPEADNDEEQHSFHG